MYTHVRRSAEEYTLITRFAVLFFLRNVLFDGLYWSAPYQYQML